jgi:hypothetical protein
MHESDFIRIWYKYHVKTLASTSYQNILPIIPSFFQVLTKISIMVTIAVPGGTGGVGRTVMDAVNNTGKHKAIALSRKVSLM